MATMKAIVIRKFGPADVLEVGDVPKPTPKARELLIKIKATSVNPLDTKLRKNWGDLSGTPKENYIIGFEGSGVVEAVGPDAKLFKAGDEVIFASNKDISGTYAEYITLDERGAGRKPKNFNFEQAAGVPLTGLTAWEGMVEQLGIQPGNPANAEKSLLVVAGAGGVGSIVIPLAKQIFKIGKVIATASRPETIEYVKKLGADFTIDHSKPDLLEQLKALGFPGGVNYVYNCGEGHQNFNQVAPTVGIFGKIVNITTYLPEKVNTPPLFARCATLTWEFMMARQIFKVEQEKQHEVLNKLAELVEQGIIPDRSHKILSLKSQIREAHLFLESGKAIGKVVLTVDF